MTGALTRVEANLSDLPCGNYPLTLNRARRRGVPIPGPGGVELVKRAPIPGMNGKLTASNAGFRMTAGQSLFTACFTATGSRNARRISKSTSRNSQPPESTPGCIGTRPLPMGSSLRPWTWRRNTDCTSGYGWRCSAMGGFSAANCLAQLALPRIDFFEDGHGGPSANGQSQPQ